MSATSNAREAIEQLSPQARETHRVQLIIAELLIEQNEHLERLTAAVTRNTVSTIRSAVAQQGAGVSAVPAPAEVPAPGGAPVDEQDGDIKVRLLEPEVPPADAADQGDDGRPATPTRKAPAARRPAKKAVTDAGK